MEQRKIKFRAKSLENYEGYTEKGAFKIIEGRWHYEQAIKFGLLRDRGYLTINKETNN